MNKRITSFLGFLGVILFIISAILGGLWYPDYSHLSNLISESYAIDAVKHQLLRFGFLIPSGFLIALFSFNAFKHVPQSKGIKAGFILFGVVYGLFTALIGYFNCDAGCSLISDNISLSQIIHNGVGSLTYLLTPFALLIIGINSNKWQTKQFSKTTITCAILSGILVLVFIGNINNSYIGLLQRCIEGTFLLWIVYCALYINKSKN